MALLSKWSATNREITVGKTVTYSVAPVFGSWTYISGMVTYNITKAWECHRYCTMSYSYVGMTYSAALSCAAAVIKNYTRTTRYSEFEPDAGTWVTRTGGTVPMADVSVRLEGGNVYRVDVNVREDDVLIRKNNESAVVENLFNIENNRTYETGDIATS